MPLTAHFVFDGSERPSVKRGMHVKGTDHWSTEPLKTILDSFGFSYSVVHKFRKLLTSSKLIHWFQALGEAEVELACMSRANIVDLVLTEDSDAVVFGVRRIARE